MSNDWVWYLVVDTQGDVLEAFNSREGAEHWCRQYNPGRKIIKVKEVGNDRAVEEKSFS